MKDSNLNIRMDSFINRQFSQISTGGYPALLDKMFRLVLFLCKTPLYSLAVLLVMMIRLFSPIVVIRLGMLDLCRIGAMTNADWYLSQKADGLHLGRYLDFFYFDKSTNHINGQWLKMWRRSMPTLPGTQLWKSVQWLNRIFPGYKNYETPDITVYPTQKTWKPNQIDPKSKMIYKNNVLLNAVLKNRSPNITFTVHEEEKGVRALDNLGILKGKQYICFHARDSAYLDSVLTTKDWSYHDYRDSSIQNYLLAAKKMANRGYYVVRMGSVVKKSIPISHLRIIDYATNGQRTDFNDIYIGGHCRFFLCSDGGMAAIPECFRRPVIYTNWTRMNGLITATTIVTGLVIFKKFFLKNENRYMHFSETLDLKFGGEDTNEIFSQLDLELIENTPDEIRAATIEMDERLNGTWETTPEDDELQECFWALFGPDKLKSPDLRIGAEYLRDNQELLK